MKNVYLCILCLTYSLSSLGQNNSWVIPSTSTSHIDFGNHFTIINSDKGKQIFSMYPSLGNIMSNYKFEDYNSIIIILNITQRDGFYYDVTEVVVKNNRDILNNNDAIRLQQKLKNIKIKCLNYLDKHLPTTYRLGLMVRKLK